jgi:hypothetical protein
MERKGHEAKAIVEVEQTSQVSSGDEVKKSTWQMVIQYKAAVLWSAFVGLGAINWGMDVLVRDSICLLHCI